MENSNTSGFSIYNYVKTNWKNIVIVLLLLAIAISIVWSKVQLNTTEKQWTVKYDTLSQKAVRFAEAKDKYYLELVTHSFALALISEIGRGNLENADLYATSLIKKDTRILEVVVSEKADKIYISTNKKHEGRSLTDYFPFNYLNLSGISIVKSEEEAVLYAVTPLFLLNEKIGTLLIKYQPEPFITK